jgi:hypothetical protein
MVKFITMVILNQNLWLDVGRFWLAMDDWVEDYVV